MTALEPAVKLLWETRSLKTSQPQAAFGSEIIFPGLVHHKISKDPDVFCLCKAIFDLL